MQFANLRNYLITGVIVLLPSLLTVYILFFLFKLVDNLLGRFLKHIIGENIPGLGFLATIIIVLVAGFLTTNLIGRRLLSYGEKVILSLPIIGTLYTSIKQIIQYFSVQRKIDFHRLVLFEYPRKGIYSMAFVFGETTGEIREKCNVELLNLFLPTTPNPTMGYLLMVPKSEIIPFPVSIEDGLKFVISGGMFSPDQTINS